MKKRAAGGAFLLFACGSPDGSGLFARSDDVEGPLAVRTTISSDDQATAPDPASRDEAPAEIATQSASERPAPVDDPPRPRPEPPEANAETGDDRLDETDQLDETGAPGPRVLWSFPEDGERGLPARPEILLQFDRAMNAASVEAALNATLPGELRLTWDGGGTRLRMTASEPLPHGPEEQPPLAFSVALSDAASDREGNALTPFEVEFFTLRRGRLTLLPVEDPGLTGSASTAPDPASRPPLSCRAGDLCAGDVPDPSGSAQVKAFMSFDLSELAQGVALERAELAVVLGRVVGEPFDARGLGALHLERAHFDRIDGAAVAADPDVTLAVLSRERDEVVTDDLSWVIEEARARGMTQYRITFPRVTDGDAEADLAVFERTRQVLDLSYLVP